MRLKWSLCLLRSCQQASFVQTRCFSDAAVTMRMPMPPKRQFHGQTTANICEKLPLTQVQANEMVHKLTKDERELLKAAIGQIESLQTKSKLEGKLAAKRWRTRFSGKKDELGTVDPTGAYCTVPEDWLLKKSVESTPEPTNNDLLRLSLVNAVPFLGFGFLDNFTMIIAGEYIENTLGMFMCISTMAAAGLGNTISDALGLGLAVYVEKGCVMLGLHPPNMTPAQMEMKSSKRCASLGRLVGITIGCLIGMFPLLFMDTKPGGKAAAVVVAVE